MNLPTWIPILAIAVGVALVGIVAGLLGWRQLVRHFVRQYYRRTYEPIALTATSSGDLPVEHHLTDVPWIAQPYGVCQSTSLQMIAAQHGIERPRTHFDFLMGFTYGASELPGVGFAPFGTDPETGMKVAAPYLGLARRYYVTDDADLYPKPYATSWPRNTPCAWPWTWASSMA